MCRVIFELVRYATILYGVAYYFWHAPNAVLKENTVHPCTNLYLIDTNVKG